ncbi:MAG TPA: trigger factor [Syntrophobacteraceae bacterium]|nr:trigger factor [Syntrophobacteraceae bacterium]HBZ57197.1 trigger factor [Syntrophobacteraceae bacterium]
MKVNVVDLSPSKKKLQIEVPAQLVQAELEKRYKELARTARIKGFRPGKVPRNVLKNYYGKAIEGEVSNHFVNETYSEALRESQLEPLAQAEVDEISFDDAGALQYTATVEVVPPFAVEGYQGLEIRRRQFQVREEMVDTEMETLRDRHAELRSLNDERPVQEGDFVVVSVTPWVDGKIFERGIAKEQLLEVGKKSIHPDFDTHLIGHRPQEPFSFELAYEEGAPTQDLAGKTVRFDVIIQEVKEKILPELNDDFAKETRNLDTLDELRSSLREQLEKSEQQKLDQEIRQQISDKLYDLVSLEVPSKAVEVEVDQMVGQLQYQFQSQGLKVDASMFNTPEIRAEYRVQGERNLRLRLILDKIAQQENLAVDDSELEEIFGQFAKMARMDVEQVKAEQDQYQILQQMKQARLHDKVWTLLADQAQYVDA